MKEGWEYKKLGEVATFQRGLTYSKKDECNNSTNIVLRSNNIDLASGKLCFDELKHLKEDFFIPNDKKVKRGCLLMCMSNGSKTHLGKVAFIDKDYGYAFGGFMGMVIPSSIIFGNYLFYALGTPQYKAFIKSLSAGANINNIKARDLEKFSIPVPPLSEQQRIVSYLDAAFAKIDAVAKNAEDALNEAKALFQSALTKMMEPKEGWEEKNLIEELILKSGEYLPSKEQTGGKVPVYGGNGVTGYHHNSNLDGEHIIIGRVGALCGNVHLTYGKIWVTDNAFVATGVSEKSWNKKFLLYELTSIDLNKYATKAVQPVISNKSLRNLKLFMPSLNVQENIARTLEKLENKVSNLSSNLTRTLTECSALKQAILRQTFE